MPAAQQQDLAKVAGWSESCTAWSLISITRSINTLLGCLLATAILFGMKTIICMVFVEKFVPSE